MNKLNILTLVPASNIRIIHKNIYSNEELVNINIIIINDTKLNSIYNHILTIPVGLRPKETIFSTLIIREKHSSQDSGIGNFANAMLVIYPDGHIYVWDVDSKGQTFKKTEISFNLVYSCK